MRTDENELLCGPQKTMGRILPSAALTRQYPAVGPVVGQHKYQCACFAHCFAAVMHQPHVFL